MNMILHWLLMPASDTVTHYALLLLRVSIGVIMIFHGFPKLMAGPSTWRQVGEAIRNLGINFFRSFWGLACALAELCGGVSLALGLGTRISCFFLLIAMAVALLYHLNKRDSFDHYSPAIVLLAIFAMFMIIGGGTFSLDSWLTHR